MYYESIIKPDLSQKELHEKSVEYCEKTASHFIDNATRIAKDFAERETDPTEEEMKIAIGSLIGTSDGDDDKTIFKDHTWSNVDYRTDYEQLNVSLEETGASKEKIMKAIELCLGLWARLADLDASRPVSGRPFAPAFEHCSFTTLAWDTGWTKYNGIDESFVRAGFVEYEQEAFLARFRDPNFFQQTASALAVSE